MRKPMRNSKSTPHMTSAQMRGPLLDVGQKIRRRGPSFAPLQAVRTQESPRERARLAATCRMLGGVSWIPARFARHSQSLSMLYELSQEARELGPRGLGGRLALGPRHQTRPWRLPI